MDLAPSFYSSSGRIYAIATAMIVTAGYTKVRALVIDIVSALSSFFQPIFTLIIFSVGIAGAAGVPKDFVVLNENFDALQHLSLHFSRCHSFSGSCCLQDQIPSIQDLFPISLLNLWPILV